MERAWGHRDREFLTTTAWNGVLFLFLLCHSEELSGVLLLSQPPSLTCHSYLWQLLGRPPAPPFTLPGPPTPPPCPPAWCRPGSFSCVRAPRWRDSSLSACLIRTAWPGSRRAGSYSRSTPAQASDISLAHQGVNTVISLLHIIRLGPDPCITHTHYAIYTLHSIHSIRILYILYTTCPFTFLHSAAQFPFNSSIDLFILLLWDRHTHLLPHGRACYGKGLDVYYSILHTYSTYQIWPWR